jgi:hypothetical protein
MGGFSSEWLALREPADAAARSTRLTHAVRDRLRDRAVIRGLDLGAGTGSNVRYLADRLPAPQEWLLVDDDETLIAETARACPGAAARLVNLAAEMDSAGADIFSGRSLVTASALLDLVSGRWLQLLAGRCRAAGAVVLFALSYDGRIQCEPQESDDEVIRALVNAHQLRDKGFGPALGPGATDRAAECFAALGYEVARDTSPWVLTPDSPELQRQLIAGWAEAAGEMAPERRTAFNEWRDRRLAHLANGRSTLTVGHEDFAGWLPDLAPEGIGD